MRLAPPFSDHAVLQRDQPIPVWGVSGPNQQVTVTLSGLTARVISGADGTWLVRLPPLPAGGPHQLVASSDSGEARLNDVLIGEVWLCSGQSNMQWTLAQTTQRIEPDLPEIRLLTVAAPARLGRQSAVDGVWTSADRMKPASFSAVAAWFGRALHRELGVPVGLICNAWGGTRIQAWMSREALMLDPLGLDEVRGYEGFAYTPSKSRGGQTMAEWETELRQRGELNRGLHDGWATPGFDDGSWKTMALPAHWQDYGHPGSGVFWFRRTLALPAAWAGRDLELHLGAIDKHDDTYVGGERVGGLGWDDGGNTWCTQRTYRVPGRLTANGSLSVAVRARSHIYHGGLAGPADNLRVHPAGEAATAVSLAGTWRYAIEADWGVQTPPVMQLEPGDPNAPYTLFDSRVAPLIPYGLRGTIWYQGESNAHEAAVYRRLLPQMIADWRRAFGQGDFPFLQVQLANHMQPAELQGKSSWAELRDAQAAALAARNVGMAVAIDVGQADNIHPDDKRTVGERLARWALVENYGHGGVPSGPLFSSMTVEADGRVRCRFRHAAGLRTRDGAKPSHVSLAGFNRAFVKAEAVIDGECLVAWSSQVPGPVAVRYAWADNPLGCNLVNGEGLPASPFRSDAW